MFTPVRPEEGSKIFYETFRVTLCSISRSDKIVFLVDFNVRVKSNHHIWKGIIGRHGIGNINSNDFRLLNLCSAFDLVITNTLFQQINQLKTTWQHSRSKHWHLIDYVIVRRCDIKDALLTRVMRGAECWTDHRLVRATFQIRIRPPIRKKKPSKRLDVRTCRNPDKMATLRQQLYMQDSNWKTMLIPAFSVMDTDGQTLMAEWDALINVFIEIASDSFGLCSRKHQDWFDDNNTDIHELLKAFAGGTGKHARKAQYSQH